MKIGHLTEEGWKRIHSGTVLAHFSLSKAEIRAPFRVFWAKVEAGTEMTVDTGHPEGELFIITSGHGKAFVGEEEREVSEGDTIYVPPNTPHWFNNDSGAEITCICIKYQEDNQT
jgi:mannose-6-phosphate isomerase-like protein (cupin superfamily)